MLCVRVAGEYVDAELLLAKSLNLTMALALSASGVRSSSQQQPVSSSVAKNVNSRPRPVHLKAFAPIYQPAPLKSGDLVAPSKHRSALLSLFDRL